MSGIACHSHESVAAQSHTILANKKKKKIGGKGYPTFYNIWTVENNAMHQKFLKLHNCIRIVKGLLHEMIPILNSDAQVHACMRQYTCTNRTHSLFHIRRYFLHLQKQLTWIYSLLNLTIGHILTYLPFWTQGACRRVVWSKLVVNTNLPATFSQSRSWTLAKWPPPVTAGSQELSF